MIELLFEDMEKLKNLYYANSFSEMKILYYYLRELKELVNIGLIIQDNNQNILFRKIDEFYSWIEFNFPSMSDYMKKVDIPIVFKENEFIKFKKSIIGGSDITLNRIKRIKHLYIWSEIIDIKQKYSEIMEIDFSNKILTFYLSNSSIVQIWDPLYINDSKYSLTVKYSHKVSLTLGNSDHRKYILSNDNKVHIFHNNTSNYFERRFSIFDWALELIK